MATLEEILSGATTITAGELQSPGSWEERANRSAHAFVALLETQVAASRLCLIDAYAAGPGAVRRVDEAMEGFHAMLRSALAERPGRDGIPEPITRALVGGFRQIAHSRLLRGAPSELEPMVEDLIDLALAYRPPTKPLRKRRGPSPSQPGLTPGRGSGELREDASERVVRATLEVVANRGFAATTIGHIATGGKGLALDLLRCISTARPRPSRPPYTQGAPASSERRCRPTNALATGPRRSAPSPRPPHRSRLQNLPFRPGLVDRGLREPELKALTEPRGGACGSPRSRSPRAWRSEPRGEADLDRGDRRRLPGDRHRAAA